MERLRGDLYVRGVSRRRERDKRVVLGGEMCYTGLSGLRGRASFGVRFRGERIVLRCGGMRGVVSMGEGG